MQISTIRNRFEAFECKLEPVKRHSNHSNANSNHLNEIQLIQMHILTFKRILTIQMQIRTFEEILSIWMQILNIRKRFAFEWKFKPNFKDSNAISTILKGFEAFECKF